MTSVGQNLSEKYRACEGDAQAHRATAQIIFHCTNEHRKIYNLRMCRQISNQNDGMENESKPNIVSERKTMLEERPSTMLCQTCAKLSLFRKVVALSIEVAGKS